MNKNILFVPECYADTYILEFLKVPSKYINHQHGKRKVEITVRKDSPKTLVAFVDRDRKNELTYFEEFTQEIENKNNLVLLQKPDSNKFLIYTCPELERWILDCAKLVDIDPYSFNLPNTPKALHDITEKTTISSNKDFSAFIKEIRKRESAPFMTLQSWLNKFRGIEL